jgi:hypothetical protein
VRDALIAAQGILQATLRRLDEEMGRHQPCRANSRANSLDRMANDSDDAAALVSQIRGSISPIGPPAKE